MVSHVARHLAGVQPPGALLVPRLLIDTTESYQRVLSEVKDATQKYLVQGRISDDADLSAMNRDVLQVLYRGIERGDIPEVRSLDFLNRLLHDALRRPLQA